MFQKRAALLRYYSFHGLLDKIRSERDGTVLKKLMFIRHLYDGLGIEASALLVGSNKVSGYQWLERWNDDGYHGLLPRYGEGRPSKLNMGEKARLAVLLDVRDDWKLSEILELIKGEFQVEYSENRLRVVLRQLGMKYAKPFMRDYRRKEDSPQVLKKASVKA